MSQHPPPPDLTGKMIGEYHVVARLGSGGMGEVYEGRHPLIGKRVAVKVLLPHLAKQKQPVDRFLAEARAVNEIRHRGIVDIFSFGQMPSGLYYFVMEYLDGQSFDTLIEKSSPIPLKDVLQYMVEILDALEAAHQAGVIHRDLKPSNIFLVDSGRERPYVKLLDFGVAKLGVQEGEVSPQTRQSVVVGTPEYISPEQARGQPVSTRTDLYALGVVMFELLTARRPFVADNPLQTMWMHVEAAVPRASDFREDLPREVDDLIMWMMKKELNERPESAAVLRAHIQAIKSLFVTDPVAKVLPPVITPVAMPKQPSARALPKVMLADEPPPATTPHAPAQTDEDPPTQPPVNRPRRALTESGLPEPEYLEDSKPSARAASPSALELPPVQEPNDESVTTGLNEMEWKIEPQHHRAAPPPPAPVSRVVVGVLAAAVVVLLLVVGVLASRLASQPAAVATPPPVEPVKTAEPVKALKPVKAPEPVKPLEPPPPPPAPQAVQAQPSAEPPHEEAAAAPKAAEGKAPDAPRAAASTDDAKKKALARAIKKASEGKGPKAAAEEPPAEPAHADVAAAHPEPVKVEPVKAPEPPAPAPVVPAPAPAPAPAPEPAAP